MKITIHQVAKIENGYEYFYTVLNDDDTVVKGNQFAYAGEELPDASTIDAWKTQTIEDITQALNEGTEAEPDVMEVTSVDEELITAKYKVKDIALGMMKQDDTVTISQIQTHVGEVLGPTVEKLTPGFIDVYVQEAYDRGYIAENTFDALKTFVSSKSLDELRDIK